MTITQRTFTPSATKEFVALALAGALLVPAVYAALEPALALAVSASDQIDVTLTVDSEISITSPTDESMSRNLGVSVNTATGDTTWNVKTNNGAGYTLSVKATTSPAMHAGANSINDYTPGTPATPETWSVAAGNAEFGFSAFGTRVPTGTWGTDSDCVDAAHVPSAALLYRDFDTSDIQIASHSATTTPTGDDATVCFAVEQDTFYIQSGTYLATVVATAATQ